MNLSKTIKRILREELNNGLTKFERQKKLIKKILDSSSYEGVCGYTFTHDEDNDRVASVIVNFSEGWYRYSDDRNELNRRLRKIGVTKIEIENRISNFLGIENLYIGSNLVDCDSKLKENDDTKSVSSEFIERIFRS
jgi:hypothetical protein